MSESDPLAGVPDELKDWHQGAIDGDPAVCAAPQPMQPGYPCIHSKGFHEVHRDVFGRTWPNRPQETFRVAQKPPVIAGVVTVQTDDHGPVEVKEPSWCVAAHSPVKFRADIEHQGADIFAVIATPCHGDVVALPASFVQRPFSPTETRPMASVELDGQWHEMAAPDLDAAAAVLVDHAAKLRGLARELRVMNR